MLIAQIEQPERTDGGDYFYRTHAPGIAMSQEDGVFVVNATNAHREKDTIMRQADILVLVNLCDPDLLPLIRQRKTRKKLTVYEIADDLGALQPWNPVNEFYQNKENFSLMCHLVGRCDGLQVTVPELKRIYGSLNAHCMVFPNQLSHDPPERPRRTNHETVVGWGGSHGHFEDIGEIAEALIQWIGSRPNVTLHVMSSDPIWQLFDALPAGKKRRTRPGSIDDYYGFLSRIDIGLGPLKDTPFNRSRSDVKFLEYAASGVVPVMSHLEPYIHTIKNGVTGFLYRDTDDLLTILDRLVDDPGLSRRISQSARRYVLSERLQSRHAGDRIGFYEDLLIRHHGRLSRNGNARNYFDTWSDLEGAVKRSRHLKLEGTRFETLLHDGLVLMQMNGDGHKAYQYFREAALIHEENYLPLLYGASVSPDPIHSLKKALTLNQDSLNAWLLLAREHIGRGNAVEALKCLDAAITTYPEYPPAYRRAAHLLRKLGEDYQADTLFKKAEDLDRECALEGRSHPPE